MTGRATSCFHTCKNRPLSLLAAMNAYWARETIDFKHIVNYVQKEIILVRQKNAYNNLWFPSCLMQANSYMHFLWSASHVCDLLFCPFLLFSEKNKIILTLSLRSFLCEKGFSLVQPASETTHFN